MEKSKSIAGIAGPTLAVMTAAELKAWNATLYNHQIAPLVYLSGILLFAAGVAIVRLHNRCAGMARVDYAYRVGGDCARLAACIFPASLPGEF